MEAILFILGGGKGREEEQWGREEEQIGAIKGCEYCEYPSIGQSDEQEGDRSLPISTNLYQ